MQTSTLSQIAQGYQAQAQCLKDKIVLVTGAGDGIGRAAALAYARLGATVLLLGKTQEKLEAVYDQIEDEGLATPALLPLDLGRASFETIMQTTHLIAKEFGRLDGLLHNAGVLGVLTPLELYDPSVFEEVMRVNFHAPFFLTQAFLPLLQASQAGSVVFTTSTVGHDLRPFWGAYALSKQGVEGLCQIFTAETRHHTTLRFNCINPKATRTNMRTHAYPGENPFVLKTPDDIMAVYVYLMSDASVGVKGQVLEAQ